MIQGMPPRKGFTFLEVVVVIFILSVFMALVIPVFSTDTSKLRDEAREMASIIRYVNDLAVTRKRLFEVGFDFSEGTVSWEQEGRRRRKEMGFLQGVELSSRGLVREGELIVFFSPLGPGEHMRVFFEHEDERKTVSFNPVSRRVTVNEDQERG
jgi:prepilin-type N-terminal cleavage/methylation domain-containing protein